MFIGFFFWYRGMALGGVARVGQVQLLQPFLTLLGAAAAAGRTADAANGLRAGRDRHRGAGPAHADPARNMNC